MLKEQNNFKVKLLYILMKEKIMNSKLINHLISFNATRKLRQLKKIILFTFAYSRVPIIAKDYLRNIF